MLLSSRLFNAKKIGVDFKPNSYPGYGKEYAYAHDYKGNFVDQEFMPEDLSGKTLYKAGNNPREKEMDAFLQARWKDKYKD